MAQNSSNAQKPSPFRLLALILLLVGILELMVWFQGERTATHHLLAALGFLLIAPNAYLNPIDGNAKASTLFKVQPRREAVGLPQLLGMLGTLLLLASFAVQWV